MPRLAPPAEQAMLPALKLNRNPVSDEELQLATVENRTK